MTVKRAPPGEGTCPRCQGRLFLESEVHGRGYICVLVCICCGYRHDLKAEPAGVVFTDGRVEGL